MFNNNGITGGWVSVPVQYTLQYYIRATMAVSSFLSLIWWCVHVHIHVPFLFPPLPFPKQVETALKRSEWERESF